MTMQQCTQQSQRLSQMVSTFVDALNGCIKEFEGVQSAAANDSAVYRAALASFLRQEVEQALVVQGVGMYLQNELVLHRLADNLRNVFRTLAALHSVNVNVITISEKSMVPLVLSGSDRLLCERVQGQEKGLKKHNVAKTSLETLFVVDNFLLKNQVELEEEKKQDKFEQVVVFQSVRKHFFRKMLRFLDKYILQNIDFKSYPYVSVQISNFMVL